MTPAEQGNTKDRITEDQRFSYIGFESFSGKPKDLFTSDAEKQKLLEHVKARRSKGDIIREQCLLLQQRISKFERTILMVACLTMVISLFLPWYSIYNEKVEEIPITTAETADGASSNEEVITAQQTRKKITREYRTESGIAGIAHIGSVLGSGFGLLLTGILYLVFTLLCLAIPGYILAGMFGLKGSPDEIAIKLKQRFKIAWLPLFCFLAGLIFSIFGGDYGFSATSFSSLGTSFGPLVYLGTLSYGVYIALAGSLVLAIKGIEI